MLPTIELCEGCEHQYHVAYQTDDGVWLCDTCYVEILRSELAAAQEKIRKLETLAEASAEASRLVMLLIEHDTDLPESAANGILGPSGYPDEGMERATKILAGLEKTLADLENDDENE